MFLKTFLSILIGSSLFSSSKSGNSFESLQFKVNDEVVTRGGIIGKIINIKDDTVTIETSSAKTRIKFDKNGISYKLNTDK